jgi:hypothetical protein
VIYLNILAARDAGPLGSNLVKSPVIDRDGAAVLCDMQNGNIFCSNNINACNKLPLANYISNLKMRQNPRAASHLFISSSTSVHNANSFYHEILNADNEISSSFDEIIDLWNNKMARNINPKYLENPIESDVSHTEVNKARTNNFSGFGAEYPLGRALSKLLDHNSRKQN